MLGEIMRLTASGKENCPKEGCFRQTFRPFKHFYFCPDRCIGYAAIALLSANVALSSNWKRSSTLVVSPKRKSEVLIVHVCSCAPFLRFHSYEEPVSQSMLHCGMISGPVVAPGQSDEKAISTCAFAVTTKESRDNKQTIILHFISFVDIIATKRRQFQILLKAMKPPTAMTLFRVSQRFICQNRRNGHLVG